MGFLLVHERMLEVFVQARAKWLKPEGKMFPTTGTIYICPFTDSEIFEEQNLSTSFWDQTNFYGVNLSKAKVRAKNEAFAQPIVGYFSPSMLVSKRHVSHVLDFSTISEKDGFEKILNIDASNRHKLKSKLQTEFDENFDGEKENNYNILITTEVLAEGINLHRSNIIINYDTPWNSTRLIQRIGRVNRIGSKADRIHVFNFFPTLYLISNFH